MDFVSIAYVLIVFACHLVSAMSHAIWRQRKINAIAMKMLTKCQKTSQARVKVTHAGKCECRRVTKVIFAGQSSTKLTSMRCEDLSFHPHIMEVSGIRIFVNVFLQMCDRPLKPFCSIGEVSASFGRFHPIFCYCT